MTEPTENQPILEEPKKPLRRRAPRTRKAPQPDNAPVEPTIDAASDPVKMDPPPVSAEAMPTIANSHSPAIATSEPAPVAPVEAPPQQAPVPPFVAALQDPPLATEPAAEIQQPPRATGEQARPAAETRVERPSVTLPTPPPRPPEPPQYGEGIVEVSGKGFGFLRDPKRNFVQNPQDIFVTPEIVRKYSLRDGQWIKGEIRRGSRGPQLFRLLEVNGDDPAKSTNLPVFDELTVVSPLERINLETVPERFTTRIMDMMTPIGKGQRGLIVAPPRTGKTTLLQHIADAVVKNHPEIKLIILLVDERPEEVTEIRRAVPEAEMMASSNDSDIKSHTRIAQLAIERAKRLVEAGKDVFVLLDSITRVGRAFNNAMGGGGRTMSGGIDARALEIPRKLFAAARNTEEAGSLTIMATALIDTGSRMDELIFQEFKGTGNMELVLDRKISDLRVYPAVDIFKSGTRREELLVPADQLHKINVIRRGLAGHKPERSNRAPAEFLEEIPDEHADAQGDPGLIRIGSRHLERSKADLKKVILRLRSG